MTVSGSWVEAVLAAGAVPASHVPDASLGRSDVEEFTGADPVEAAELTEKLARNDMVVQEMKGIARAGDGSGRRVLTDDLSITYLGWALRTR